MPLVTMLAREECELAVHDEVCLPDGCIGEVIGFYRTELDEVLVRHGADRRRYLRADLRLLDRGD